MGFTSSSTALSGIEDLIRGPVTKELILEQVMYEPVATAVFFRHKAADASTL